ASALLVIPAKAGIQRLQRHASVEPRILAFAGMTQGEIRDDAQIEASALLVIPAKAGIQRLQRYASVEPRMPAFAGMTAGGGVDGRMSLGRWS
ncbi:hypothetical protein, partial [Lysobacter capsici]